MSEPITVVTLFGDSWHMKDIFRKTGNWVGRDVALGDYHTVPGSVVLATGERVLNRLCGLEGIAHWRGSVLRGREGEVIIPTLDPGDKGKTGTPLIVREPAIEHVIVRDIKRAVAAAEGRGIEPPEYRFTVNPSLDQVTRVFDKLSEVTRCGKRVLLSLDVETKESFILTVAIAWNPLDSLCIPFVKVSEGYTNYWNAEEETEVINGFRKLLQNPYVKVLWQNGLFDAQHMLKNWLFAPANGGDTMLRQHVCFPGMKKSLDFIASFQCDYYKQWKGIARDL